MTYLKYLKERLAIEVLCVELSLLLVYKQMRCLLRLQYYCSLSEGV